MEGRYVAAVLGHSWGGVQSFIYAARVANVPVVYVADPAQIRGISGAQPTSACTNLVYLQRLHAATLPVPMLGYQHGAPLPADVIGISRP